MKQNNREPVFRPRIIDSLKDYNFSKFSRDVLAGLIVGLIALPLALAFAISSGVPPQAGLATAIVAGFLISATGGSSVQIGGPTGAFVVIVFGIVHQYGISGLAVATFMAGVILVLMGLAGFGAIIRFVPHPVTVGFTSGIALTIFSMQIKDFLGLQIENMPAHFIPKIVAITEALPGFRMESLLTGLATVGIIVAWPKVSRKIPGPLVALIVTTAVTTAFSVPVETIGSRFGEISASLKLQFNMPNLETIQSLIVPAATIAMLGAIESLLSAAIADGLTGDRHRPNTELIGQGIANMASPLFGGIPATGAIARSVTNIKSGAVSPVSGIVHAFVLFLVLLFFATYAALIPMATLAGILVIVSWNMSERHTFAAILKSPRSDVVVLLLTFFLTVLVDLTVAIQVGILLAVLFLMRRLAQTSTVTALHELSEDMPNTEKEILQNLPSGLEVYEIDGPFFFGTANIFQDSLRAVSKQPRVRIFRMRNVPFMDATGIHMLEKIFTDCRKEGTTVILSEVRPHLKRVMEKAELHLNEDNVTDNFELALAKGRHILAQGEYA